MDVSNIIRRKNLISLPVSSGWLISKNELYTSGLEDLETLFSATNLMNGKSLTIEFDEESEKFDLMLSEQLREKGKLNREDFSKYKLIKASYSPDEITLSLKEFINGNNLPLVELKVPNWWFVRSNFLLTDVVSSNDYYNVEFLFKAFSTYGNPYYVEVSLIKGQENVFNIFVGLTDQTIPKLKTRFFEATSFVKEKSIQVSTID